MFVAWVSEEPHRALHLRPNEATHKDDAHDERNVSLMRNEDTGMVDIGMTLLLGHDDDTGV